MTLDEIYKKETGNDSYECFDGVQYAPSHNYVEWLEKKIEKLTSDNSYAECASLIAELVNDFPYDWNEKEIIITLKHHFRIEANKENQSK